jgi:hypothetical protein
LLAEIELNDPVFVGNDNITEPDVFASFVRIRDAAGDPDHQECIEIREVALQPGGMDGREVVSHIAEGQNDGVITALCAGNPAENISYDLTGNVIVAGGLEHGLHGDKLVLEGREDPDRRLRRFNVSSIS